MLRQCAFAAILLFPTILQAQLSERGTFVMFQGQQEVLTESYSFDGTTLTDTVDFLARGIRMESVSQYDADFTPTSYELDLYRDGNEIPVQYVGVQFNDTAAVWSTRTQLGDSTGVTLLDDPFVFMQNLVFAHLAVVLLKYDHGAGGDQSLNVWMPEQAAVLPMRISFTSPTIGNVEIAGTAMNVEVDESGWLRRAAVPVQNVTVESREPGITEP